MERNTRVKIANGFHAAHGRDGYWLDFTAPNGNGAGFNIDAQSWGHITKRTVIDWIDEQLKLACPDCKGHGTQDTPFSGSDPSCATCRGEGVLYP